MPAANQARTEALAAGATHYVGSPCRRGHDGKRFVSTSACVDCSRATGRQANLLHYRLTYKLGGQAWVNGLTRLARNRARDKGVPFDAKAVKAFLRAVPRDARCPVFDVPLHPGGGRTADSPTLDRLRPELGYVEGNLRLLSSRANMIKSDATPEELRRVADWLEKEQAGATLAPKFKGTTR